MDRSASDAADGSKARTDARAGSQRGCRSTPARYRVTVCGHLDDHWSEWLEDVEIHRREDGTTALRVNDADPSALYGLLVRLRDLGLTLAAVERLDD